MKVPLVGWWRDGEDAPVFRVYHYEWLWTLAAWLMIMAVFPALKPKFRDPIFFIATGCFALRFLCEGRRALLVREDALVYRPTFERAHVVPWKQVQTVERVDKLMTRFGRPHTVSGLQFTLKDGSAVFVPLDVSPSSRVPEVLGWVKDRLSGCANL